MKAKIKQIIVEAHQWFKNGDHPNDNCIMMENFGAEQYLREGEIVRRFRNPEIAGNTECTMCGARMFLHGWIDVPENGYIVCPSDWIITGDDEQYYPCKNNVFEKQFEKLIGEKW